MRANNIQTVTCGSVVIRVWKDRDGWSASVSRWGMGRSWKGYFPSEEKALAWARGEADILRRLACETLQRPDPLDQKGAGAPSPEGKASC